MDKMEMLGRAAHDAGKMRSPSLDPLVMQELDGMPVGTGAVEILTAWTDGWDAAQRDRDERAEELRWESAGTLPGGQPMPYRDTL